MIFLSGQKKVYLKCVGQQYRDICSRNVTKKSSLSLLLVLLLHAVVNMKLHQSLERKKLSLEKKILMTCHRTLLEDSQVCPKDICCFFSKVGLLDSKAMNSYKFLQVAYYYVGS